MKYLLCGIYLIFSVTGLTFMKIGSSEKIEVIFSIMGLKFSIQSLIGYASYAVSFLLYTIIISKFDLSFIVPLLGGILNVVVLIIGVYLFKERATLLSILGTLLIIIGIVMINLKTK